MLAPVRVEDGTVRDGHHRVVAALDAGVAVRYYHGVDTAAFADLPDRDDRRGCPACAGAMPADQMGLPLIAVHDFHLVQDRARRERAADLAGPVGTA